MSTIQSTALDESSIRNVLGNAVWIGDEGRLEDYGQVYAADAGWRLGDATRNGLQAIIDGARGSREAGTAGPGSGVRHIVTPLSVKVDGDTAEVVSYFLLVKSDDGALGLPMFGRYEDSLRRTPEGWRISLRRLVPGT